MTTNQTIGGVPRELRDLLERVATEANHMLGFTYASNYDECRNAVDELRALLDAPADPGSALNRAWQAGYDTGYYAKNPAHSRPMAAQPQGEPVGWYTDDHLTDKSATTYDRAVMERWKTKGWPVIPFYAQQPAPFQSRVQPWMLECFGEAIAADRQERNHRFLEEALELVQANQCTVSEAHQLVDYVYSRPVGEPSQEVGGVMVTLAALCLASELDMHSAAETELSRIWKKVDQIRAKQAAKPAMSPLPGVYPDREQSSPVAVVLPDRMSSENGWISCYSAWNACLDEVTRLNTKE